MIVQELFKSLDKKDFIKYYCQYECVLSNKYRTTKNGKKIITDLFDKLCNADPILTSNDDDNGMNEIIFCIPELGTISCSTYSVYEKDLLEPDDTGYVEHYGIEFDSMLKVLGYKVSDACLFHFDDPRLIAASILYEMTFFGYTLEDQEDEAKALLDSLHEQVEDIKEKEEKGEPIGIPADEVFNGLGWVDNRSEKEIFYQNKCSEIYGNCGIDLRDLFYDMERDYLNGKIK